MVVIIGKTYNAMKLKKKKIYTENLNKIENKTIKNCFNLKIT